MPEYKLPDVGEGLTEAEIVTWKVKVGDVIAINDIVVEIETAKSLVELPSPYAGTVTGLLVPEGEMVPVGTPIIAIAAEGEAPAPAARRAAPPQADLGEIDLSNPARQRWRRGREPGRPQQGRARLHAPAAQGRPRRAAAAAQHRPTSRSQPRSSPASWRARPSSRPTSRPCRRTRRRGPCGVQQRRRPHPRQAAGPQAGQGPRRRHHRPWSVPVTAGWSLARTCRPRRRHRGLVTGASAPSSTTGQTRDARAHQGRPQDDGAGDGRLGLLRARTSPSGSPST